MPRAEQDAGEAKDGAVVQEALEPSGSVWVGRGDEDEFFWVPLVGFSAPGEQLRFHFGHGLVQVLGDAESGRVRWAGSVTAEELRSVCCRDEESGTAGTGTVVAADRLTHLLVEDTDGRYTAASWDISQALVSAVRQVEAAGHGTLIGTVHTHPPGVPDPSGTDVRTTTQALNMNPHLSELLVAVVTEGRPRSHDLPVGPAHRMSLHVLRRDSAGGPPQLTRTTVTEVPLVADLAASGVVVSSATTVDDWAPHPARAGRSRRRSVTGRRTQRSVPRPTVTPAPLIPVTMRVDGRERLLVRLSGPRTGGLLIDGGYPTVGPLAISLTDGQMALATSPWNPAAPPRPQLAALTATAIGHRLAETTARVAPLLGVLTSRHVLVAGLGSVGSRIAEDLVRCGVGTLTVIDPDIVAEANLSRTVYARADIGEPKPEALARRLQAINPAVVVRTVVNSLGTSDIAELLGDPKTGGVNLVVGATDDMREQALLAHHAYAVGTPLVSCALYKGAAAGEVALVVPSAKTACWLCATGQQGVVASQRPETDYALDGRLVGEIALGPPIHLVANVATTATVGLLAGPDRPAGEPLVRLLGENRTLGLISTTPNWDHFPELFEGMDHQYAPQSVWVVARPQSDCTVCGRDKIPPQNGQHGADLDQLVTDLVSDASSQPFGKDPADEVQPDYQTTGHNLRA